MEANEYSKFKKLLEYFVDYLTYVSKEGKTSIKTEKLKENVEAGLKLPRGEGSGGKPSEKLQEFISEWAYFDDCSRVYFRIGSFTRNAFEAESNYLQWADTGYNIVSHWENHAITGLRRLVWVSASKERKERSEVVSLTDLGLFDDKEPNETLKKFFDDFKKMYIDDSYEYRGQSKMSSNEKVEAIVKILKASRNLILHGAPGTGKTFLAKEIAKRMGCTQNEIGFVQFHPSYDYTDFVEGLRPKKQSNGEIGFERKDGVFKEFCKRALQNLIDSKKSVEVLERESSINDKVENFLEKAIEEKSEFETATGNKFTIIENAEKNIFVSIPANEKTSELSLPKNDLIQLLNSENKIENGADIKSFFNRKWRTQQDSYIWILYKEINSSKQNVNVQKIEKIQEKKFIFIIDEINRGELSKIFGELFFCIDPGYRGKNGMIKTQYQNLIEKGDEFYDGFFIPENVYIIGTMNDIDRSVDTMDFAFRRRFAFKEIKASENLGMLDELGEIEGRARNCLENLNKAIEKIPGLSSAYHIGGAYFKNLESCNNDFEELWNLHLEGLLREYLRGQEGAEDKLKDLENAYKNEGENTSEASKESAVSGDE